MIEEGQSFHLKHEDVKLVHARHIMRLYWLYCGRQNGPLKLQDSIAHVHLAQVAKVMSSLISVGQQRVLVSEL